MAVILLCLVSSSHATVTLFVTNDSNSSSIEKFTAPGTGTAYATSPNDGLSFPTGIVVGPSSNLFVGNSGSIEKILTNGFGVNWSQTGVTGPNGEVYDSAGNLYVASSSNAIYKYDTNGVRSTYLSGGLLSDPFGLAMDSLGNFYVSNDTTNNILNITNPSNVFVFASGLNGAAGLALDSTGANLYVSNTATTGTNSNSIMKFDTSTRNGTVFANTGLNGPRGLAFDKSGNLYAANFGNNTIEEFSPSGTPSQYANTGLSSPDFIAVVDTAPEPSVLLSLALGLGILGLSRRRRIEPA